MNTKIERSALDAIGAESRRFIESSKGHYINGRWHRLGETFAIIDPSTELQIGQLYEADADTVEQAVAAASAAFEEGSAWRTIVPCEREILLHKLADAIAADRDTLADLIAIDLGLPKSAALAFEVAKVIDVFRYYAGFPSKITGETLDIDRAMGDAEFFAYTTHEPVGVVGAILPWNAPLLVGAWKIAPALAAGCTLVVKPAEDVSLVILRLAELASNAGLPDGVLNVVTGCGAVTGQALIENSGIDKFAFTGSTDIGKRIYKAAADRLVRVSLELGGKNPVIVLPDVDINAIAPALCMAAFANSGQICVSGSKVMAHASIAKDLVKAMASFAETLVPGSPFDTDTIMGPVCSKKQFDRVMAYIRQGEEEGTLVVAQQPPTSPGFFISPTIITELPPQSKLLHEEIFGPVITVETWTDERDVIQQVNRSAYGLCATIWGNHHGNVQRLAKRLRTGTVFINSPAFPPANIPTGGFRQSGVGRDLGRKGLEGFLEPKSVIARIN
ncbi:aldehyde dehydrogenase family protein [Pseudomonas sp. RGM2987]|uniref:aldehyde dehydrogenase family protein n=1 Tax=Pseudomonas sp. RGM2987 TaxID=2930090 RepID=UPI001FD6F83E|nr:aldehyde dehydrogenase family protein [Pseudomonas sp. RGM2987]MCJ8206781.1 aldehyde dehydrogenase family protein [Pseudomonas sp. RGM2987]